MNRSYSPGDLISVLMLSSNYSPLLCTYPPKTLTAESVIPTGNMLYHVTKAHPYSKASWYLLDGNKQPLQTKNIGISAVAIGN